MHGHDLKRAVEILLVEDNPGDVELTIEALQEGKVNNHLSTVEDGIEALAFLRREEPYQNAPRPDLILLDLNLPRKGGRETLAEIKQSPELCDIPIVILTTSDAEKDITASYKLHANCYIKKNRWDWNSLWQSCSPSKTSGLPSSSYPPYSGWTLLFRSR